MVMDTNMMVVLVMILALVAIGAFLHFRRHETHTLEKHFGPEYGKAVEQFGSPAKAEAELKARQKRVEQLDIVPLSPQEAARFAEQWKSIQGRFVDDPKASLGNADDLVRELMQKRGYPIGDFDRRAADISVNHPAVVEHYRAAQDIAVRNRNGEVDTEGMRQAVIHYRALFAELLEVRDDRQAAEQADMTRRTA